MLKVDYGADRGWRSGIREVQLGCYDLHCEIVSLGTIKIKNVLTKQFNAKISRDYDEPYFATVTEAEKALEWILQQYVATKMVGKETIEQEKKRKNKENAVKRAQKEQERIDKQAADVLKELAQYIGREITMPIHVNHNTLNFTTQFIGITFRDNNYYILTAAGELRMNHKHIHFDNGNILSVIDGRNGRPHISASGPINIRFNRSIKTK